MKRRRQRAKRKNPDFIISEHVKERFAERFPRKVKAFNGDVDKAVELELQISRRNFKSTQGHRLTQLLNHNFKEAHYYTSAYAVFVVGLDNTVTTVYERRGSFYDNAAASRKRCIDIEKRRGEQKYQKSERRRVKTQEKRYIRMRRVIGDATG